MVVATSPRGEFAVMDGHAALLAVIEHGPVRIHAQGGTSVFACRSGTLRTDGDRVSLLVDAAVPIDEIDPAVVDGQLAALADRDDAQAVEERKHLEMLRTLKERYG